MLGEKSCGNCNWSGRLSNGEDKCLKCGLFGKNWSPVSSLIMESIRKEALLKLIVAMKKRKASKSKSMKKKIMKKKIIKKK